jgi:hypothetical protein
MKFQSDVPTGKDCFGRAPFARALAAALVLPANSEGLVVGIEGPWGSGKSFVINQLKSILTENDDRPIILEFNPWIISGTDSLVEALLEQIGAAIGKESDPSRKDAAIKAGASVLRYLSLVRHLKYLKYVPGVSAVGMAAEDLSDLAERVGKGAGDGAADLAKLAKELPEHSLTARKSLAIEALKEVDRPIIVILDDLDRVTQEEIRSVVQAVKAVANFPRTAYLLSYDPDVVANALDADKTVGRRYLEKIVQVQYPLPVPLPWRMRSFAMAKLAELLRELNCVLTADESARFDEIASYVARLCRTPRDMVRLCNRLRISLPATLHEVDSCDVILLEALAVCEPQIESAIRQNPEDFTEAARVEFETFGQEFYFVQSSQRIEKGNKANEKEPNWRKRIPSPISPYAEGVLMHLFPIKESPQTLRVRNWERLYRYLALGPSEFITEIRDLQELVANERMLKSALSDDDPSAMSILRSLEIYHREIEIGDIEALVVCLSSAASTRLSKGVKEWDSLCIQYEDVLEAVLRNTAHGRGRLIELVIDLAPLSIGEGIVRKAASDLGLWNDESNNSTAQLIPDSSEYYLLRDRWIKRVETMFNSGANLQAEPALCSVLYRIGQLSEDFKLSRAIGKKYVEAGNLHQFLMCTRLAGSFGPHYGNLDIVWDGEELLSLLTQDSMNQDQYKRAIDTLQDDRIRDYFKRRTDKPTKRWPPDESHA